MISKINSNANSTNFGFKLKAYKIKDLPVSEITNKLNEVGLTVKGDTKKAHIFERLNDNQVAIILGKKGIEVKGKNVFVDDLAKKALSAYV
ncbi:MAG: hypothetical protein LBJ74_03770 [Heliobacteriaceae bacterium]|jgi:hypothetical protein|nr:hypothetical protein [Heliobacteriaceae bacterium]